jgi:hypothetical protein
VRKIAGRLLGNLKITESLAKKKQKEKALFEEGFFLLLVYL